MRQIVLNILIAFLWVLFQDQGSFYSLPLYPLSYRINYHLYTASILWSRILFSKIWVAIKF